MLHHPSRRSFLSISFINKYWIDISRLGSGSCFCLPSGIFQILCSICIFEKVNISPLHMTMFVAASQSKVNGVYKQSVLSKVSGFEIPTKFFSYKMFTS